MLVSKTKEEMEIKVKEKEQLITAIYRLNLHCNECARAIEKPIIRTQGVENVNINVESGKVTIKGIFDPKKMHELIEKKSGRKVEWISPKPKEEVKKAEKIEILQKKEEIVKTTIIKVHLHCEKCENDLENKLLKLKDVYSVKMDRGEQICTIVGIIEEEKLVKYIHKKAGKRVEILSQRKERRAELKEFRDNEGEKKEGIQSLPYFIHCTHAPQWFSDENPNSCIIM